MKNPSEAITNNLLTYDPALNELKDLFDYAYQVIRKNMLSLNDLVNYNTVPDSLLDYILYSKGIPLYFNYTATQKRALLANLSQTVVAEVVGSSGSAVYSGTLEHFPVIPGSVTFTDGTYSGTDTTNWIIKGTGISNGYIDYNTGSYKITFTSNTAAGVTVDYSYKFDLNSKRYTTTGLEDFVKKILPSGVLKVDVYTDPKDLMFLEFRLYGFPNQTMRDTAGETYGDQVGYIPNIPQLSGVLNTTAVLIYSSATVTAANFTLLCQVLFFELKNTDFTQSTKLQIMKVIAATVSLVHISSDYKITNGGSVNFTTLFASPGQYYIGVKHSSLDSIKTYKISAVQNSTTLLLDPDQDFIVESGMVGYSPELTQIADIEI